GSSLRATVQAALGVNVVRVLCHSDCAVPGRLARADADQAAGIVVVDGDAAAPSPGGAWPSVQHVVVSAPDAGAGPQPVRRDALVLRARASDRDRRQLHRLPDDARRGLLRIARAVSRRRVAVALGGGAAWGYAHVALI